MHIGGQRFGRIDGVTDVLIVRRIGEIDHAVNNCIGHFADRGVGIRSNGLSTRLVIPAFVTGARSENSNDSGGMDMLSGGQPPSTTKYARVDIGVSLDSPKASCDLDHRKRNFCHVRERLVGQFPHAVYFETRATVDDESRVL